MHALFSHSLELVETCVAASGVMHFSCVASAAHFFNLRGKEMNVKVELLKSYISDFINCRIEDFEINASQIADSTAVQMLSEIQKVIKDENYSDFDAIEEIVCIFEKYKIDAGCRHDF